jgi:hypothetical protein
LEKTNFNVSPYYDDFDESKNFHRILFRPGFAVQGRELTQLQTILQNQIERFGTHIFKDGSPVTGAQTNFYNDVTYLKLETTYSGQAVDVNDFDGLDLVDLAGRGVRARVIAVAEESTDPPTLMVRYITGVEFNSSDILALSTATSVGVAKIRSETDAIGLGSVATIAEGVFFIRGYFVHCAQQIVILDKYDTEPSYDVGLEITESVVSESDDTSLLDPALDSSNYQAPGAYRFSITLAWSKRTSTSSDLTEFVKLMKIESGNIIEWVKYPIYNEIEKTLARRTYDESGSYTVKSFRTTVAEDTSNNNQYIVTLDAGKAYVFGFEFETISPTAITVAKPRVRESVNNYALSMNYGNYVFVSNANSFFNTSLFTSVDLHCVQANSIDFAGANAGYFSTYIGQASIRDWVLSSAGNSAQANSYIYRAHLFDANVLYWSANSSGTNCTASSINLASANISTVANAYVGVILNLVAGPGAGDRRTITSYDGTTKIATVDQNFSTVPTSSTTFRLDFQFKDVESLAVRSLTGTNAFADIHVSSKDLTTTYDDTYLTDTDYDRTLFELPYQYIVATDASNSIVGVTDVSYQYRKVFTPTLTSNTTTINLSGVEQFVGSVGSQSSLAKQTNWFISVTTPSGSTFGKGAVVPVADTNTTITLSGTQTANVTIAGGGGSTVAITALVSVSGGGRKTKTKVIGNTTAVIAASPQQCYNRNGSAIIGANVFASAGQISFTSTSIIPKTSEVDLMLYIPDVYSLLKVVQSSNAATAVTTADMTDTTKDITSRYTLDTGMRDGFYDHARIRLKPGERAPVGQLRVCVSYYDHDVNAGYFSVDSYPNANNQTGYAEVPVYISSSGKTYSLRDCIDFRARKTFGYANTYNSPVYIAASQTTFSLDFAYYLARIDHVVLTRDRRFEVVRGIDALVPTQPKSRDDAMLLSIITLPPYVTAAANVSQIRPVENKRYTMRDIGALEKRVSTLEYYTTLSLLESGTLKKNDSSLLDDAGLERTKYGIVVDSFGDFSASDSNSLDFRASLDIVDRRMKPAFNNENYDMTFYANGSIVNTYQISGHMLTLPWSPVAFVYQNVASKTVNINPFNVTRWAGTIKLQPSSDTWVDVNSSQIVTNPQAGLPLSTRQTLWSTWTVLYQGHLTNEENHNGTGDSVIVQRAVAAGIPMSSLQWGGNGGTMAAYQGTQDGGTDYQIGFTTTRSRIIEWEEVRTSQGTRILSTTIIPFIRSRAVVFGSKNMRPNTAYYPYFDGTSVLNYVRRSNVIQLENVSSTFSQAYGDTWNDTYGNPDLLQHYDNTPPTAVNFTGSDYMLSYANMIGLTVPAKFTQGALDWVVAYGDPIYANTTLNGVFGVNSMGSGGISGGWHRVSRYEHYSGNVVNSGASSVTIANSAHANASFYSPSIGVKTWAQLAAFSPSQWAALGDDGYVRIVSGTGAGQARQITGYMLANNTLTLTANWTTLPDTTSGYSMGVPRSLDTGHIGGVFHIPNTSILQFRTGDRVFKLTDDANNVDTAASSIGSGIYSASGMMQEVREDIVVTRRPLREYETSATGPNQITFPTQPTTPGDPIAQSFNVDPVTYPNGVFISKFRFCFSSKDSYLPVRCQLRSMVNGFPHSQEFITECVLNPQFVNVTTGPSLLDSSKYTDFQFTSPVYLAPNKEYAVVLMSDSNQYNVYASEMGATDINTGAVISRQPTLGSLFKSQNGSTWTPVQEEDLMFGAYACQFTTSTTANVQMRLMPTTANANVDVFYFSALTLMPPGTNIDYFYRSELVSGGTTALKAFNPNETTYFGDQSGRRIFKANSNNSFAVVANMTTSNQWVSPAIDLTTGLSVFGISYLINNGELSNNNIVITNGGTGYLATDNANITLTISGGGGTGATATVNSISGGVITDIIVTNPGSGYYFTPNLSISFSGNAVMRTTNTNVAVSLVGETSASGGNAQHRYVMKRVKLADGFDSSDIRVYLTGYKPLNSSIYVYYKVLSSEDADIFENKSWNVMTQLGNTLVTSQSKKDLIELTFAPGTNGVPSKEINYNGYATFRTFAIKVVTFSTNTVDVPEFCDIRVIALPSGKVI